MLIGLFGHYFFGISIFITSVFLVMLVLVQRGRGGGLVGALGGPGGQSALGTKAGDVFTRITVILAGVWIFLNAVAVWSMQGKEFKLNDAVTPTTIISPVGDQNSSSITTGMTGDSKMGFGDLTPGLPSVPGAT